MPMVRARISPVPLLLLASLSSGLATALSKVALKHVTSLDLFAVDITLGAVFLSIVAFARGARPARPAPVVVLLGILEPGLAYLLFDIGLTHTAATHGALLLTTDTLFTVGLAATLLGE